MLFLVCFQLSFLQNIDLQILQGIDYIETSETKKDLNYQGFERVNK